MIRPITLPLAVLAAAGLIAMVMSVGIGSVAIAPADVLLVFLGEGSNLHRTLILELRLPRTLSAFATGGLLAVAGALMQVLLRNPLADPYVLGLSGVPPWGHCWRCWRGSAARLSPVRPLPVPCWPP